MIKVRIQEARAWKLPWDRAFLLGPPERPGSATTGTRRARAATTPKRSKTLKRKKTIAAINKKINFVKECSNSNIDTPASVSRK